VNTTTRALAAGLASAAALLVPAQTASADPNAGTAVISSGPDYYVSAESVTIHEHPSDGTSVVDIAQDGEVITVQNAVDPDRLKHSPGWWIEGAQDTAHAAIDTDVPTTVDGATAARG